jgi:hypothetical protein
LPDSRTSRCASLKRLGVSFQFVRRENMQEHDTGGMDRVGRTLQSANAGSCLIRAVAVPGFARPGR